jgi:hypothetical protein
LLEHLGLKSFLPLTILPPPSNGWLLKRYLQKSLFHHVRNHLPFIQTDPKEFIAHKETTDSQWPPLTWSSHPESHSHWNDHLLGALKTLHFATDLGRKKYERILSQARGTADSLIKIQLHQSLTFPLLWLMTSLKTFVLALYMLWTQNSI